MQAHRRWLIFDASAINQLAADPDCLLIVRAIVAAYGIRVTESSISEIVAYADKAARDVLLDIIVRLLKAGICILPFHAIIQQQAKAYVADRLNYSWRHVDVRLIAAESEVVKREIIDMVSDENRASNQAAEEEFKQLFATARADFQRALKRQKIRPSLQDVIRDQLDAGGPHLAIAGDLVERAVGQRLTDAEIRTFVDACPPLKALLVALCFSQYDRCMKVDGEPSLGKAGRIDILSSVYLPYARLFVTHDKGQLGALTAIAKEAQQETEVLSYLAFRDRLFGLSGAG